MLEMISKVELFRASTKVEKFEQQPKSLTEEFVQLRSDHATVVRDLNESCETVIRHIREVENLSYEWNGL